MRRGRFEVCTIGQNPNLALVGSDPLGGPYDLGIFIGANGGATDRTKRQLIALSVVSFNAGQKARLVGFRQLLTIGVQQPTSVAATYPLERPVETPTWKYVDGNVLWGIRRVPPSPHWQPNALNGEGLAFEWSETPAQLFEDITAGVIMPPYGGDFPGNVLVPELGRFFEMRCRRWSDPVACDVPIMGPCSIVFFASIQQTNPSTRTPTPPIGTTPIPVSQQFNGNAGLPANTANEHWYVVTTTGATASIGQLLFDNGTAVGNATVLPAIVGQSIIPSTNFTGGTISLNAGQVYVWNGSAWIAQATSPDPGQFTTTNGTVPEDAFVQNYPGSTYFRVAGSLIFDVTEDQAPTGAPKTYRRPGDADRITRDTADTNSNVMRRSAEDENEYKACEGAEAPPKRPATPPKRQGARSLSLAGLPLDDVEMRIVQKWRQRTPGRQAWQDKLHKPPQRRAEGLADLPKEEVERSEAAIAKIARTWREQVPGA